MLLCHIAIDFTKTIPKGAQKCTQTPSSNTSMTNLTKEKTANSKLISLQAN